MGYTHYWEDTPQGTDAQWDQVKREAQKIFDATDIPIQRDYENDEAPLIDDETIWFNGVDDDGHETFAIHRGSSSFNFCKTALKPYDTVCVAILRMLVTELPGFKWTSDGDHGDFAAGLELYERARKV